jgi:hypothetical protein
MEDQPIIEKGSRLSNAFHGSSINTARRRSSRASHLDDHSNVPQIKSKSSGFNLEERVRNEGIQDAIESFKLYGKILLPAVAIALWMFALAASLSWAVPNKLCYRLSVEASGSQFGLLDCAQNTGINYAGAKTFFLTFNTIQFAWMAFFPGLVAISIFGKAVSYWMRLAIAFWTAVAAIVTIVTGYVLDMPYNNFYAAIAAGMSSFLVAIFCAPAAVQYTNDPVMRWRWICLFIFGGMVNIIYSYIIPTLITARSEQTMNGMAVAVFRLLVHPIIWQAVFFYFRTVMRHIGHVDNLQQTIYMIWPMVYSSLYGRFLLLQLEDIGSVIFVDFLLNAFELCYKLVERSEDEFWLSFVFGKRYRNAHTACIDRDEMEMTEKLTKTTMEMGSIMAASAVLSFGGVAVIPGQPPDHITIWRNAMLQVLICIIFQYIGLVATGKFHAFAWEKVYPRNIKKLLFYCGIVVTFGGLRLFMDLLVLFCPKYYDEHGLLLEKCDKPSLFQALKFSFVTRLAGTSVGSVLNEYLEIDPVNGVNG